MSNYEYVIEEINGKRYIRGWLVSMESPDYLTIFPYKADMPKGKHDEYGQYQYRLVPNPGYGKLIDVGMEEQQPDIREYLGCVLDLIDPGPEVKEAKRVEKVKARFEVELPDLVYANKDNPAALAAAMCDRMKGIDAETTIVKELER